ncbi:MAG: HEAT repeat domain-containing protein [Myxococcales bacterium]|nr:HEAT repeat domain-containing protein [Myxococcales bacterium]
MGLRDFFNSGARSKNKLDRLAKAIVNQYGQSADRYHAMQQLLEIGTVPAIVLLMKRFTMNASKSIEDEEEKGWVFRQITGLDKTVALPAAKEFCTQADNIAWVLRIVEELADEKQEWEILDALLERHPPTYARDPATKQQMLTHVAEIDNPRVAEILARYLEDPDESIRFQAAEALLDIADGGSLGPLVGRLANKDEDSLRLRTKILTGLSRLGWDVSAYKDQIVPNLGSEHVFDGTRIKER